MPECPGENTPPSNKPDKPETELSIFDSDENLEGELLKANVILHNPIMKYSTPFRNFIPNYDNQK